MNNRNHLTRTSIVDKNGKATTVYRKSGDAARSLPTVTAPAAVDDFSDADALALVKQLEERLVRPNSMDWDSITWELGAIRDWEHEWTDAEKRNLRAIAELTDVLDTTPLTDEVEDDARDIIASLEPAVLPQQDGRGGWSSSAPHAENWRARDKTLHSLANDLLIRRMADDISYEPVNEFPTNPRMMGLEDAQKEVFASLNHPSYNDAGKTNMGDVEPYLQESIARAVRGDTAPSWLPAETNKSLLPESERVLYSMTPNNSGEVKDRQLYLSLVFPVKELKTEMDRVGIDNVSVSGFDNGREWGNVYTVMTPDGSTRSFSVYEHRNTDSIIINGTTNWDGKESPYASDSKRKFFGEFAADEHVRAAQSLTFYMMQAQKGELTDDEDLVRNAPHRDWNAILDESIPGFKEWRQEKVTDTYIAPEDEGEDDILKRLDFS